MKGRAFAAVVLSALLLLSGLGIGGWWLLWRRGPLQLAHHPLEMPRAARFVPATASFSLYLFSDGQRPVDYARAVAPARQRRAAGEAIARLRDGAFAAAGLDYSGELAGWLGGESAMALFEDPVATATGGAPEQPARGWLLALASRDDDGARRFLQRFWQTRSLAGTDLQVSRYRGMGLISGRGALLGSQPEPLATALVDDDLVLIASGRNLLERALDASQIPELNQAGQPLLRQGVASFASGAALAVASPQALQSWLGLPPLEVSPAAPVVSTAPQGAATAETPSAAQPGGLNTAPASAEAGVSVQSDARAAGRRSGPAPDRSGVERSTDAGQQGSSGSGAAGGSGAARMQPAPVASGPDSEPAAPPRPSSRTSLPQPGAAADRSGRAAAPPAAASAAGGQSPQPAEPSVGASPQPGSASEASEAPSAPSRPSEPPAGGTRSAPVAEAAGAAAASPGPTASESPAEPAPAASPPLPAPPPAASSAEAALPPADRPAEPARSRRAPWAVQPAHALTTAASGQPSQTAAARQPSQTAASGQPTATAATLLAVLQPQGRQLELRARLLLPQAPRLEALQPDLAEVLLTALRGSPSSLALIQDPAAVGEQPLLRPLLERSLGLRPQALAERQGPLPSLLARSVHGPLLASQATQGWQLATRAGDPAAADLQPLLRQEGLLEASLDRDGHSLRVWTRLALPARTGRRERSGGDALEAPLAGWSEQRPELAWWGQTLALRDAPPDSHGLAALRRGLRELGRPQAPLQLSLDDDKARALLRSWQPWRLLSALAGGGLDAPVQGLALALETPPEASALDLHARLDLGA